MNQLKIEINNMIDKQTNILLQMLEIKNVQTVQTVQKIEQNLENINQENQLSNLFIVLDNILNSDCQYIVHQTNTTGLRSSGISAKIFKAYPKTNIYKKEIIRTPGTIIVKDKIINLFGQIKPGKPNKEEDTYKNRLSWFISGLNMIGNLSNVETIAIPYGIGCGLSGGNWCDYEYCIKEFCNTFKDIKVYLYKYENDNESICSTEEEKNNNSSENEIDNENLENECSTKCKFLVNKNGEKKQCNFSSKNGDYCTRHLKLINKSSIQNNKVEDNKKDKKSLNEKNIEIKNSNFIFNDSFIDIYNDDDNFWSTKSLKYYDSNNNIQMYRIHLETNLIFAPDLIECMLENKPISVIGRMINNKIINITEIENYNNIKVWCNNCNIIV
jgi:hypothetical protein